MPEMRIEIWPDWKIIRTLGSGSFGQVFEIHRQNGSYLEKAALKVIRIPSSPAELLQLHAEGVREENTAAYLSRHVDEIRNEIGVMQQFVGDSNIVSYEDYRIIKHSYDVGWDILIRMELLKPLSSFMMNRKVTEDLVINIGADIAKALESLHGKGVIHRDIKPQNIFINDRGFFKLGDFGISRAMPQTGRAMSFKGTVSYMAPETFSMRGTDARSDIYSLALVLYKYLNEGREPFLISGSFGPEDVAVAQNQRLKGVKLPPPTHGSKALAGVLLTALNPDPARRYQSARQFREALLRITNRNITVTRPQDDSSVKNWNNDGRDKGWKIKEPFNRSGTGTRGTNNRSVVRREGTFSGSIGGNNRGGITSKAAVGKNTRSDKKKIPLIAAAFAAIAGLVLFAVFSIGPILSAPAPSLDPDPDPTDTPVQVVTPSIVISFKDANLEEAVRNVLNLEKEAAIKSEDVGKITNLDLSNKVSKMKSRSKIKDLSGLRYFSNLTELNLSDNIIEDISELGKLTSLRKLVLSSNKISDISALENLTELDYLDLGNNSIEKIEALENLRKIHTLIINGNYPLCQGDGIYPIGKMTSLTELYISRTGAKDIDCLKNLTNLEKLSISYNHIQSITPITGLDSLKYLDVRGNGHIGDKYKLKDLENRGVKVDYD